MGDVGVPRLPAERPRELDQLVNGESWPIDLQAAASHAAQYALGLEAELAVVRERAEHWERKYKRLYGKSRDVLAGQEKQQP